MSEDSICWGSLSEEYRKTIRILDSTDEKQSVSFEFIVEGKDVLGMFIGP